LFSPGIGEAVVPEAETVDEANEPFEKMYRWYVLGCRMSEQQPMSREDFAEQKLLRALTGGALASEVFDRTAAEWELAREDAKWTTILQGLLRLNLATETNDLVRAIQTGRELDEEGESGSAGVPARRSPFLPVLVGAGAKLHPDFDPDPLSRDS